MSQQYYGNEMHQSLAPSGSVKRARERAVAGLPRPPPPPIYPQEDMDYVPPGDLRAPPRRPMAALPPNQQRLTKTRAPESDGRSAVPRPVQVPQWPLSNTSQSESEPYRPPPGRPLQPPQRPPRPSQVISPMEQSHLQDSIPAFMNNDTEYYSVSPVTSSSSPTSSSFGDNHDYPLPPSTHNNGQRRSANLGPPPSSRRGASSFYSNPSYVTPIPEESLASRSHGSFASSAAMPESWPTGSRAVSPVSDKSHGSIYDEDFGDESKLVRSASIGKRGKPSLITTKSSGSTAEKKLQSPPQSSTSPNGHDAQSPWMAMTTPNALPENPRITPTPDAILGAYAAASATDLTENRIKSPEPQGQLHVPNPEYNKMSAIRRPLKLDMDAVRNAEERGSMTSLPDLIRRATKLASMIDRGRRPASRFEDLSDYLDEKGQIRNNERGTSGLSDMLAAFPPPAQGQTDRQSRGSWFRNTSWPLAPSRDGPPSRSGLRNIQPHPGNRDRRGRCCGLPIWGFVLLLILVLAIIAAAIFVPLEFFVWKNLGNKHNSDSALKQCQQSLNCKNGGTNVISGGTCSCICTNGFTGWDCGTSGTEGCTTTDIVSSADQTAMSNVTIGKAIPRLIASSFANFSIPLSATSVIGKLNKSDLSCIAQNSLVTFDGSATREGSGSDKAKFISEELEVDKRVVNVAAANTAISVSPDTAETTLVLDGGSPTATSTHAASATSAAYKAPATETGPTPTSTFTVTEEVLDFARVAVLYVLQQESQDGAESAQTNLQAFFKEADGSYGATEEDALSLKIGGDNTVDLVHFTINLGAGTVGGKTKRDRMDEFAWKAGGSLSRRTRGRRGRIALPR
ncbi:hypothetical protein BGZ63DRAFT_350217 [Mariannaea sp. PMI_226]|nr:hypothetical protein BGZ63DRAFT_350217 [Mariannaea sp. PMI_226]